MKHLLEFLNVSLEDLADGKARNETEHVFYAKIKNFADLEKAASKEFQEQWEIKVPHHNGNIGSGTIRARASSKDAKAAFPLKSDITDYTLTIKSGAVGSVSKLEGTLEATQDVFTMFSWLASSGMRKVRHCFPVAGTDLVFEVDVFMTDDGFAPWCKIDLEVKDAAIAIPPLPFEFDEVIKQGPDNTDTQKVFIRNLFETVFLTKERASVSVE